MSSKKVKNKSYFLTSKEDHATACYTTDKVVVTHHEKAHFTIIDNGNGYSITDISPGSGTLTYEMDYAVMADLFAALKILYHNADKEQGEYWTVFCGEKV